MDDFVHQEFLGQRCTYGDDRHLTNLILKQGYDVVYIPEAIAYTYTPTNYKEFMKQQLRWRRGFIREALFCMSFIWTRKPWLGVETLVWELGMPFLSFSMVIFVCVNAIVDPSCIIAVIPLLMAVALVRNMPIIFYAPYRVPWLFVYTLFSTFIMHWQTLHALFTLKDKSWATR